MIGLTLALVEGEGAIERSSVLNSSTLVVERLRSSHRRPFIAKAILAAGEKVLFVNRKGTMLVSQNLYSHVRALPPSSLMLAVGPVELSLSLARGDHERLALIWKDSEASGLGKLIEAGLSSKKDRPGSVAIVCQPQDTYVGNIVDRLTLIADLQHPERELNLWGAMHFAVAGVLSQDGGFQLASIPFDLPESVTRLLQNVKKHPASAWALKDAAEMAGYSPFHLSRTFKSMVGYGFPEFVDRCRTELAFEMLSSSELSIDDVAAKSGFGSTHGLRESIKEYLGLLPSELRSGSVGSDPSES